MDSTGLEQVAAGSDGSPTPAVVHRDQLTAGLALARTILAQPAVSATTRQAIAEFHASVVQPLLEEDASLAERHPLLRWASVLDGAALFEGMALALEANLAPMLTADVSVEEVAWDLMQLTERIKRTGQVGALPPIDGPELLIGQPDGECLILTIRGNAKCSWCAVVDGEEWEAAGASAQALMSAFPTAFAASPEAWSDPPCICWPPEVVFSEEAAALPLALGKLSELTGLSAEGLLSAGHFDGEEFSVPTQAQLLSWRAAARLIGRDLLVPAMTGWQRFAADDSPPQQVSAPRTLEGAASVIWAEDWTSWTRTAHTAELARLEWHFVEWRDSPAGQPITDRWIGQVGQAERYCLDKASPGSLLVLGGTARSGRSAIVRQLARNLSSRRRPWLVGVISGPTRELPDRDTALAVATHALGSMKSSEGQASRRLLVFEDLQPIGGGNASEVLRYVAEQLRIVVLGVLQYAENSPVEWDTDDTVVITSVVSRRAHKRFVEELAIDPDLDPAPALEALKGSGTPELRMLTKLMNGDHDATSRRSDRFEELTNRQREALARAAAISLISVDLDEEELALISDSDRALFGVGPGRSKSTARLSSAQDCFAVLDLYSGSPKAASQVSRVRELSPVIASLLKSELGRLLRAGDPKVSGWLDGMRLLDSALCRTLLKAAADDQSLQEWSGSVPIMSLVHVTTLVDLMADQAAQELAEQLIVRTCRGSRHWSPAQLLTLMRACQYLEPLLSSAALDELILWLVDSVDRIIAAGTGRPAERFALLAALDRFNRPEAANVIAARALDVLAGLTVCEDDYQLIQRVDRLQRKVQYRAPSAPWFPIDQENPVQSLLTHKPDPSDGVVVLLEAMNLRLSVDRRNRFEDLFSDFEIALNQALQFATASELGRALYAIRSPVPQFSTWLLSHWADFPARARALMVRGAAAADSAILLRAVSQINGRAAFKIIDDQPSEQLAAVLAKRAADVKDAKGIGQLLSVTRSIEDTYGRGGGFSTEIAEALGKNTVQALIEDDPRTSVRYHIINGLWDAQASYRADILEAVLSIITLSVRPGHKHWGPELALRLALDPEMGVTILDELRRRITPETMLTGMTSANTAHGRALFHRLGRALHPEIPARFSREWDLIPFAEGLATSSPTAALEVCVEVSRTLADANLPYAGELIVAATGGAERWAHKLRFGRQHEAFAQAVRNISLLDRVTAGEVLDRLRSTPSRLNIGGHSADALLARLRNAMLDGPTVAPLMLRAIHDVRPQLASDLLADVSDDQYAIFVFRGELQQLQDPTARSRSVRSLIRVGVTQSSARSAWIAQALDAWIQGLAHMTGPRPVTATLRMFSTWESGLGRASARAVNISRIKDRLRYGALTDIGNAIDLARTLAALDSTDAAKQVLEQFLDADLAWIGDHLEVDLLCKAVDICRELLPDRVPYLVPALATAVKSLVERSVVFDERTSWLKVGWACRTIRQTGSALLEIGEPRIPPNIVYAPTVGWAATGIGQPGWGQNALGRAAAHMGAQSRILDVTDQACVLSATGHGWAPDLRTEPNTWQIATAPFWLLRILYAEEAADPYLKHVLAASESVIAERTNRDTARPDWDAFQLRQLLSARTAIQLQASSAIAPPHLPA